MAITLTGHVADPGTLGNILTSNGAGLAPTFQLPPSTNYQPLWSMQGFSGSVGAGGVVIGLESGQGYLSPEKSCTVVLMTFSIANTTASQSVTIQPYGAQTAGSGALLGNAKTVTSPAANAAPVFYTSSQSLTISPGGYIGVGVIPTSTGTFQLNIQLWITQSGI